LANPLCPCRQCFSIEVEALPHAALDFKCSLESVRGFLGLPLINHNINTLKTRFPLAPDLVAFPISWQESVIAPYEIELALF
jgi:hypothetical protein